MVRIYKIFQLLVVLPIDPTGDFCRRHLTLSHLHIITTPYTRVAWLSNSALERHGLKMHTTIVRLNSTK